MCAGLLSSSPEDFLGQSLQAQVEACWTKLAPELLALEPEYDSFLVKAVSCRAGEVSSATVHEPQAAATASQ
jgi:hypothetical protein